MLDSPSRSHLMNTCFPWQKATKPWYQSCPVLELILISKRSTLKLVCNTLAYIRIFFHHSIKLLHYLQDLFCHQLAGTSSADCNANYGCNKCAPRVLACARTAPQRWCLSASESAVRGGCERKQWGRLKRKTRNHAVIAKQKNFRMKGNLKK